MTNVTFELFWPITERERKGDSESGVSVCAWTVRCGQANSFLVHSSSAQTFTLHAQHGLFPFPSCSKPTARRTTFLAYDFKERPALEQRKI